MTISKRHGTYRCLNLHSFVKFKHYNNIMEIFSIKFTCLWKSCNRELAKGKARLSTDAFAACKQVIILLLMTPLLLTACSSDDAINGKAVEESNHLISFLTEGITNTASTRATQTTKDNLTSFGVSCSIYSPSNSYTSSTLGSYFYNQEISASTGKTEYYWPGNNYKLSFFAYAPYNNSNVILTSKGSHGRQNYTYTVPSNIDEQIDLITAESLDISGESSETPVVLSFSHACTDIKLSVNNKGEDEITVHSITICGLRYTGTYSDGSWTLTGNANTSTNHAFKLFPSTTSIEAEATVDITGTSQHIIVLPQTIASGTDFIIVDATIGDSRETLTYTLEDELILEQSKSYNMKISLGVNYIDVDATSDITDWEQEEKDLTNENNEIDGTLSQPSVEGGTVTGVDDWSEQ